MSNKPFRFRLSVCVDFLDELLDRAFTEKDINALFRAFKSWGMTRIYWVYTHRHDNGYLSALPWAGIAENYNQTYDAIGELLPAVVKIARDLDLEIYAVYKPFDLAHNYSFPFGSLGASKFGKGISAIGGDVYSGCRDLGKLADFRSACRWDDIPADINNRRIQRIRLVSCDASDTRITKDNFSISVSSDNGSYTVYPQSFSFYNTVENGFRILTIDGLNIASPFLALHTTFKDNFGTFSNRLDKLVELYDEQGRQLPFTYGLYARADRFDEASHAPPLWDMYPMEGYDFNIPSSKVMVPDGSGRHILDNIRGYLALAKGKERYVVGTLSPAYDATHDLWLRHIQECLDAGVDGVDIRVENHNRALFWEEYGFEAPVVEAYRRLYGKDKEPINFDREKQASILANAYTDFYRKASNLIRGSGKRVQLHIGPGTMGNLRALKWDWKTWLQESLADEITLKEADPGGSPLFDRISQIGNLPPIHTCPWLCTAPPDRHWWKEFSQLLERAVKDGREAGFILYESAYFVRVDDGGRISLLKPAAIESLRRVAKIIV